MSALSYQDRRGRIEAYFDRTAADAWRRLTSDVPVSGIRATVRAGRNAMRETLLSWLPDDLTGARLLDAGCGTGPLAVEAARRGAHVVAVDLSATLLGHAAERLPADLRGKIEFRVGDMREAADDGFDYAVAMDSLIHYPVADVAAVVERWAGRVERNILFTFAPRTPLLATMITVGKLFPKSDRSPAIEPVGFGSLKRHLSAMPGLAVWSPARTQRIASGFYTSQALELTRESQGS